jgi:hypothetical protein
MPFTLTKLIAAVGFIATAQGASHAASSDIAEVSTDYGVATVKMTGTVSATNDNWVGGLTSVSVPIVVDAGDAGSVTVTPVLEVTSKECEADAASPKG